MSINSVSHAIRLVELLAQHLDGLGISAIADRLDLPRPTVYRLVATLIESGWCHRRGKSYRLSPRLMALANASSGLDTLMQEVDSQLHYLVTKTGETAHFAVLEGTGVTYVAKVDSPHPIRMFSRVGWHGPVHATAVGKALLARTSVSLVDRVLSRPLPRYTDRTITAPDALRQELARVRRRGYAIDREELIDGLVCVAVGVSNDKELLGAFSVAGPKDRMRDVGGIFGYLDHAARGLLGLAKGPRRRREASVASRPPGRPRSGALRPSRSPANPRAHAGPRVTPGARLPITGGGVVNPLSLGRGAGG